MLVFTNITLFSYKVGSDVKNFKVGDRVGVPWLHSACGVCEHCMTGWETLCAQQHMTGYSVDGGHSEYSLADGNYAIKLPDKLSFEQAARKQFLYCTHIKR